MKMCHFVTKVEKKTHSRTRKLIVKRNRQPGVMCIWHQKITKNDVDGFRFIFSWYEEYNSRAITTSKKDQTNCLLPKQIKMSAFLCVASFKFVWYNLWGQLYGVMAVETCILCWWVGKNDREMEVYEEFRLGGKDS